MQPKRDMDLVRELLLRLENLQMEMGDVFVISPEDPGLAVPGYDSAQIEYHLSLLRSVGMIECPGCQPGLGITFSGLTWNGHDFLDSIRDPEIWRATKEGARRAGGFSVDLLGALAKGLIKKQIEKHTGVQLDL